MVRLQLSWEPGRVVAWAGGPGCATATADEVGQVPGRRRGARRAVDLAPRGRRARRREGRRGRARPSARCSAGWSPRAPARSATTSARASAGWAGWRCGPSSSRHGARWCRCSASADAGAARPRGDHASYSVRWTPALVDPDRLADVVDAMPGSVAALDPSVDARAVTRSALTGMVDAICRDSARRIEVPAAPPVVRTGNDVAEAFLARLDGSAFDAPMRIAGEIVVARRAVGPFGHRRARAVDRAPRPARPHRRVGPRGVRREARSTNAQRQRQPVARCSSRRARHRRRPLRSAPTSKTRSPASNACCPRCCAPAPTGAARSS